MEEQARSGDTVHVHYTGTLANGREFDSSRGSDPIAFTLGAGQVVPGFESAVMGMQRGESKTVTIPADEAYGEARPELMLRVPRTQVPPQIELSVGQQLQLGQGDDALVVVVKELGDAEVVLDGNHPLAGEDLTFALELVRIE